MSNQINKDTNTIEDWRKDTNRVSATVGLSADLLYGKAFHNYEAFDSPATGDDARIVKLDSGGTSISTGRFHIGNNLTGLAVPVPTILAQEYANDLFSIKITGGNSPESIVFDSPGDPWVATTLAGVAGHTVYQGSSLAAATWSATIISIQDENTATPIITFGTPAGTTGVIDPSANIINNNLTETLLVADFTVSMITNILKVENFKVFISERAFDPDSPATAPANSDYGVWEETPRPQSAQEYNGWYLVDSTDSPGTYSIRFVQDQLTHNKVKVVDSSITAILDGPYPRTKAEESAGVKIVEWYEKPGTFERYGAIGSRDYDYYNVNWLSDDTVAIQAAFDQNAQLYGDPIRSGKGPYNVTSNVHWGGTSTTSHKTWYAESTEINTRADITAITIGTTTPTKYSTGFTIIGSISTSQFVDTTSTKAGIILGNLVDSEIRISNIFAYHTGLSMEPNKGWGRNNIYVRHIQNFANYGIKISPTDIAKVRNNVFYGGEYHTEDADTCVSFIHIDDNSPAVDNIIGTAFIAPSFHTDAVDDITFANAVVDGGINTMWVNPDFSFFEGTITNSHMQFTATSNSCQVVGGSNMANVDDLGTNNTFLTDSMIQFKGKSFGVNSAGAINTNQAEGNSVISDSPVDRIPIYSDDSPDTLIGYIPIYAAS